MSGLQPNATINHKSNGHISHYYPAKIPTQPIKYLSTHLSRYDQDFKSHFSFHFQVCVQLSVDIGSPASTNSSANQLSSIGHSTHISYIQFIAIITLSHLILSHLIREHQDKDKKTLTSVKKGSDTTDMIMSICQSLNCEFQELFKRIISDHLIFIFR